MSVRAESSTTSGDRVVGWPFDEPSGALLDRWASCTRCRPTRVDCARGEGGEGFLHCAERGAEGGSEEGRTEPDTDRARMALGEPPCTFRGSIERDIIRSTGFSQLVVLFPHKCMPC